MKRSEAIVKYTDTIEQEMIDHYRTVLECDGSIQYKIYVWSDGEIECLEGVQGDNSYLKANDMEERELFYVTTIAAPCFDPWDYTDHSAPEDETEREQEQKETIDYLVGEYETNISDLMDSIINEAEMEERYE